MDEGKPGADELRQSLARLHSTLASSGGVDESSKRLLRQVLGDIERLLHGSPGQSVTPPAATAPSSRIEAMAARFDAGHPTLSAGLRELVDLLSGAGL